MEASVRIGDPVAIALISPNFQVDRDNPLSDEQFEAVLTETRAILERRLGLLKELVDDDYAQDGRCDILDELEDAQQTRSLEVLSNALATIQEYLLERVRCLEDWEGDLKSAAQLRADLGGGHPRIQEAVALDARNVARIQTILEEDIDPTAKGWWISIKLRSEDYLNPEKLSLVLAAAFAKQANEREAYLQSQGITGVNVNHRSAQ